MLGVELITRPEESYRLWYVVVCDLEISEWVGPGPLVAVAPKGREHRNMNITSSHHSYFLLILL
jgi:hypothetical protein